MFFQSITGWQDHVLSGRAYLKTACNGLSRPAVFNNELIFQLAAMAIEKMIVGVCQCHHEMPCDHTLSGLVECLGSVCPVSPDLAERITRIELADDMCSLKPVLRSSPSDLQIQEILSVGRDVDRFTCRHVPLNKLEGARA